MRKLILATAILMLSSAAFAGPRGLSSPQAAEPQKSYHQAEPAAAPVEAKAPAQAQPEPKPVKAHVARKRESDEQKARRIAARYGISW
ncbi:unnamed protein product [Phaeothamnion confervicola]